MWSELSSGFVEDNAGVVQKVLAYEARRSFNPTDSHRALASCLRFYGGGTGGSYGPNDASKVTQLDEEGGEVSASSCFTPKQTPYVYLRKQRLSTCFVRNTVP